MSAPAPNPGNGDAQAREILSLLARPPRVDGIDLDLSAYGGRVPRTLLPDDYVWQRPGVARPSVPLLLCEFLAYKAALAYEGERRIASYLAQCCRDITDYRFFDSTRDGAVGILADAQGFGFVFQERAYIVFRGTESNNDWVINRTDTMTDALGDATDRRTQKIATRYGDLLDRLGPRSPGRHVGFSIAWAALKQQVDDWLARVLTRSARSVVYTGHSLGGAMAKIAAYDRARAVEAPAIAGVVTFGAPMAGNADFAADYKARLGDRTVLLEASGDLVPRIMQRWYFRMLYPLRQRAMAGLNAQTGQSPMSFATVSSPWKFSSEPPLSQADIDAALSSLREAARRAAQEIEKQQTAARKKADEEARRRATQPTSQPAPGSGDAKPGPDGKPDAPQTPPASAAASEPTATWVHWVVGGAVVVVIAGVAWYFVRRKLFSHDIQQRYALYLSTLSYQQLRAKHGGDLALADQELDEHLAFIRGDFRASRSMDGGTPYYDTVQELPVKIAIRPDPLYVAYLKRDGTFV